MGKLRVGTAAAAAVLAISAGAVVAVAQGPASSGPGGYRPYVPGPYRPFGSSLPDGFVDPGRSDIIGLVDRADVYAELKLDQQEKQAIDNVPAQEQADFQGKIRAALQGMRSMPPADRRDQMVNLRTQQQQFLAQGQVDIDKKVAAILSPSRYRRLKELDLQWRGPLALADPTVAAPFSLTVEQTSAITNLYQDYQTQLRQSLQNLFASMRGNRRAFPPAGAPGAQTPEPSAQQESPPTPQQMQDRLAQVRQAAEKLRKEDGAKVLALLMPEQAAAWNAALGRRFDFPYAR